MNAQFIQYEGKGMTVTLAVANIECICRAHSTNKVRITMRSGDEYQADVNSLVFLEELPSPNQL